MKHETILDVFPGESESQRLVVASECCDSGCEIAPERLVLRQESYSEAVGWFVQSRIAIDPAQVAGLKSLLTSRPSRPLPAASPYIEPAILKFPVAS